MSSLSLPETLRDLKAKGYHIADTELDHMPPDAIQSDDWRVDEVRHHKNSSQQESAVVIAVSSSRRNLKLVFVEMIKSKLDFSPLKLLRRLFTFSKRQP
jgi:hypothetical protein